MKQKLLTLFVAISCLLSGCKVNRYYFVAEEQIDLYEYASFTGQPVLTASVGDTVTSTGSKIMRLGGLEPVEYKGFRFYSPRAKARLLYTKKVNPKKDAFLTGVSYTTLKRRADSPASDDATIPSNYGYTPSTGAYIHTGPRGGRYYINSNGNKTYIKRGSTSNYSGSSRSRSTSTYRSSGSSYRISSSGRGRR
jgi:hypothetical protein